MSQHAQADKIAKICEWTTVRRDSAYKYPFCLNVKIYTEDLSYPNLLKHWREYAGDHAYTHNPEWIRATRTYHEENADSLWSWGLEDLRDNFTGKYSDVYRMTPDGRTLDVTYEFIGRSGGWLSISQFEGIRLADYLVDPEELLADMDANTFQDFYTLVHMLYTSWHDEKARARALEAAAAFTFFANICSDVPRPVATQLDLFRSREVLEQEALV